jgi:hypothetical protein
MNGEKPAQIPTEGEGQTPDLSFSGMRDRAIFIGWIGGLLLLGGLLWFFTQPSRLMITGESVNRILSSRDYPRRLGSPLPRGQIDRRSVPLGTWYALENLPDRTPAGRALIFSMVAEGAQAPCMAVVSPDGRVEELIPLNDHGERMLKFLSGETMGIYIRRIENSQGISRGEEAE